MTRRLLLLRGVLLFVALVAVRNAEAQFAHPGLLNTADELEFMKEKILAAEQPWTDGYARISSFLEHEPDPVMLYRDGSGHSDPEDINMQKLRDDGQAAYGSALHWFVSGEPAHAEKAVEIVNAWSSTIRRIETWEDGSLSTSYGWPNLIYAAEIIKHTYDGWSEADQQQFKNVLLGLVWPATEVAMRKGEPGAPIGGSLHNNWTSMAIMCRMAIAIFSDDEERYEATLDRLKQQIAHYIYPSGQSIETARDLWHSQMGIAPLVAAAEMAWHQGDDVYSYEDNRILTGAEWHAPFVMGYRDGWPSEFDSPYYSPASEPDGAGNPWPFYEMVYNHYNSRMGLDTPNTWRVLTQRAPGHRDFPVRPEGWARTGGWGTATHVRLDLVETSSETGRSKEIPDSSDDVEIIVTPNPFFASTRIGFRTAHPGFHRVQIFDAAGRHVRTLAQGYIPAGLHAVDWDGTSSNGFVSPSGVYLCLVASQQGSEAKSIVMIR